MAEFRINAVRECESHRPVAPEIESRRYSEIFGKNVFNEDAMRQYLSKDAFKAVMAAIESGARINRENAKQVASGMKQWAIDHGATHYSHWFQPLSGASAEKHDAFFEPIAGGRAMERFDGAQLIQQEPDASSFPNGGLRNTFEARGYTAWDPTSPAFVIGTTLCIPTVFVAYTGEALDNKTPLLRSISAVDAAATAVCQYFDKNVTKVISTLGAEQEYFLVDAALYHARPDLVLTGRTLFGQEPAKGQQMEDHYFGAIPSRVLEYLRDLEQECMKLGIPVKTRHNEVALNQFEIAPIYEEANIAVDHNMMLMEAMQRVSEKHNFKVLFHEKPFEGLNGSGKHNNWSLATDTGVNLLSPGKTPKSNLQFLTFFVNAIKAVHDHADLLRACIASASNDHRLGANEAPPAIISIFIGSQLSAVLAELEQVSSGKLSPEEKTELKLNVVGKIPEILLDNTDRNRTSPFAFTGNKFEFRAPGSSINCAMPMTVMNTIMASQLKKFKAEVDAMIEKGIKKDDAIFNVLRDYIKASSRILFEGDGYSDDWVREAEKRGLSNLKTTPEALDVLVSEKTERLFASTGVMKKSEVEARYEIELEKYQKTIQIEARVMGDIARNHIIPTAIAYQNRLLENVRGMREVFGEEYMEHAHSQVELIKTISDHIVIIKELVDEMIDERRRINKIADVRTKAREYAVNVKEKYFDKLRYHCDKLEIHIDDEVWPLVKYRELLFAH
ncbi:MAG TPA: glutamine synthetase III [Candidatus Merdimorpha stercoravium]|uniref:Glutamine synthetase III n=1 Tax=Candidatus Merdimorpha stercoravium TaxID=2840863 RepID=A0A9D1KU15_9FLAO|nr:glutamine synthetase III [Candidatus Merdimorpha stercoravium]